jgi:TM2 domain-containing membrane protein YozV
MIPLWTVLATRMKYPSPSQWAGLFFGVLNWIVVPGIALLLGALPFLKARPGIDWKLRVNTRTRAFWLPALISLTAAMACLTISTLIGLQARFVVRGSSTLVIYVPWLLMLPFCGAAGASFSRHSGGQRSARLAAALSPVIALASLVALLTLCGRFVYAKPQWFYIAMAVLFGSILPGLALFLGALPFAKASRPLGAYEGRA